MKAVIGSMFGDEGKGLFTDYLSSLEECSVVRFNGGAQAGHTVTTPEGQRHIFGSLGSGSFQQRNTFLSSYFVFNPLIFNKEFESFQSLHPHYLPHISVNNLSYLSTPFDMALNQLVEAQRGDSKHGSCGLGFGETIERCERAKYITITEHLFQPSILKEQFHLIQKEYFPQRLKELNIQELGFFEFVLSEDFLNDILKEYLEISQKIHISQEILPIGNIVFEGAQGLLLDQKLGYFPHVTRSYTGLKNIMDLRSKAQRESEHLEVIYATRCYTTRHGQGPLSNVLEEKPYDNIVDMTNVPNIYQGTLRYAYLDLDILMDNIQRDIKQANADNFSYRIGISCLDQTDTIQFYENSQLQSIQSKDFPLYVKNKFNIPVLGSWGPTRETIIEY